MKIFKRALLIIVLVILSWADTSAQLLQQNVLYHKNGSIIRGTITFQSVDTVKIKTECDNYFVFPVADLLQLTMENKWKRSKHDIPVLEHNEKGLYSYSTIGFLTGKSEFTDNSTFSFQTNIGYQFNHLLGAGLGVGLHYLKTELLPIVVSVRSNLLNKPSSPSINLHAGYAIPLSDSKEDDYRKISYEGGFCFGFDIGGNTIKTKNRAFSITIGYQYQVLTEKINNPYGYWYYNTTEKNTYQFNKIAVRVGFLFK